MGHNSSKIEHEYCSPSYGDKLRSIKKLNDNLHETQMKKVLWEMWSEYPRPVAFPEKATEHTLTTEYPYQECMTICDSAFNIRRSEETENLKCVCYPDSALQEYAFMPFHNLKTLKDYDETISKMESNLYKTIKLERDTLLKSDEYDYRGCDKDKFLNFAKTIDPAVE